jgi:hypothetical protein
MPEDRGALLEHYRAMRADMLAVLDGLSAERLTEKTLDGWSVKDHLAHLSLWDDLRAAEVSRISAGHDSVWRMSHEQDEAYNDMGYTLRTEMSVDQVRWEMEHSRQTLMDAIASATPRGLDASLYGEAGLHSQHEAEHAGWIKRWRAERGY